MASTASETLNPGMPVYDIAGSQVGMIRAVRGGYFDLDTGEPGYWLSVRYITCEDGRGVLTLPMRELAEHRLMQPGLEPSNDIDRAGLEDHVIGDEEALSVRERMERELREQRGGVMDTGLREN